MKIKLTLFAAGLLLGIYLLLIYCTVFSVKENSFTGGAAPKELLKQAAGAELVFAKKKDSLQEVNKALSAQLQGTKTQLKEAKKKATELQLQVFELLDTRFAVQPNQYPLPLSVCDSLAFTTAALMKANDTKDSLQEGVAANLEAQLRNKDSTIVLQTHLQESLKSAFLQSVQNGEDLLRQNKLLQRSVRIQKIKSKFLSAALLVISGAAAGYLITH